MNQRKHITRSQAIQKEIEELKNKYGNNWLKYFQIKANYPFGKKSKPQLRIVARNGSKTTRNNNRRRISKNSQSNNKSKA